MIIFIFIIMVILSLLYIYNLEDDKPNKVTQPVIKQKVIEIPKVKPSFIMEYNASPAFRGLSKSSTLLYKHEKGGSKIFNHIKMDNINATNNIINYRNYNSYRIKPRVKESLNK